MINFARISASQMSFLKSWASKAAAWGFPVVVGVSWFAFPAIDQGYRVEKGWSPDPEAEIKLVQAAKNARMEAYYKEKGLEMPGTKKAKDEDEEEEEPEPETEEEEEEAGSEEEEEEDDDDDGTIHSEMKENNVFLFGFSFWFFQFPDDDEDEAPKKKSALFNPVKKANMTLEEQWDLFTLKAINYGEEDDDDDGTLV